MSIILNGLFMIIGVFLILLLIALAFTVLGIFPASWRRYILEDEIVDRKSGTKPAAAQKAKTQKTSESRPAPQKKRKPAKKCQEYALCVLDGNEVAYWQPIPSSVRREEVWIGRGITDSDHFINLDEDTIGQYRCLLSQDDKGFILENQHQNGIYLVNQAGDYKAYRKMRVQVGQVFYIANVRCAILERNTSADDHEEQEMNRLY